MSARVAVSSWRRSWGSWFQAGSGAAAGGLGGVGSDGQFMVRDLLRRIGTEPGHHDSEIVQRCHVDAGAIASRLDWAGWRICGIIYQDRPGEGQADRGPAGRLHDPAWFIMAQVPSLAQHLHNLTCQRMVGADDPHIPHSM
jgi:hypothetical protein